MDWLRYANQGATRNQPLSPELSAALGRFLPQMGLTAEVFSGGQPAAGGGARVGSVRHDHGGAADVFFHRGNERLDWANPAHQPIFQDIVRQGRAAGLTGFGAGPGYMQPGSMHIGFGTPGVWGAGGSAANAPAWLTEAFAGAPAGSAPAPEMGFPISTPQMASVMPQGGSPNGTLLGDIAATYLQNYTARQQQRQAEEEAEQLRRTALLSGGLGGLYG